MFIAFSYFHGMKVKISPNPEFDFTIMEMGGFDDIPTKQDKFKPLSTKAALLEYSDGSTEIINNEIYIINESKRQNQQTFETNFKKFVGENVELSHPYKKPLELEVVIGIIIVLKQGSLSNLKEIRPKPPWLLFGSSFLGNWVADITVNYL